MSFDFFLTDDFVWSYCGLIVAAALYWAGKLSYDARALHAKLRNANDELSAIDGKGILPTHLNSTTAMPGQRSACRGPNSYRRWCFRRRAPAIRSAIPVSYRGT